MKEIITNNKSEELYLKDKDYTLKYDVKNEFLFISLSCEDLTNATYTTYCDPSIFDDVSMYDLECLEDYSENDLNNIYDLLTKISGNK